MSSWLTMAPGANPLTMMRAGDAEVAQLNCLLLTDILLTTCELLTGYLLHCSPLTAYCYHLLRELVLLFTLAPT